MFYGCKKLNIVSYTNSSSEECKKIIDILLVEISLLMSRIKCISSNKKVVECMEFDNIS